eukprot:jgi/Chlat1/6971/Chrsp52S06649
MQMADFGQDTNNSEDSDPLVQYVVLRKDLSSKDGLNWPLGSVVAQACHASVAALWLARDHPDTLAYCEAGHLDHMRKVVLEVKGEVQLRALGEELEAGAVAHKLWTEQPEDFPTCIATAPARKSRVQQYFKKCKLAK